MRIYKKYFEEKKIIKTTFRKQREKLSNTFVDLELIKDALNKGECINTAYALYSKNREDLKI